MADKYRDYAALLDATTEGVDFDIALEHRPDSRVVIIAPHAGGIESRTGEIAEAIAGTEFSLYCFRGIKRQGNRDLHITSHRFDEPRCLALLAQHDYVIAIHGCRAAGRQVFLGGRDKRLTESLKSELSKSGIVAHTTAHKYQAKLTSNICNRGRSNTGVQFELSRAFRHGNQRLAFINTVRKVLLRLPTH